MPSSASIAASSSFRRLLQRYCRWRGRDAQCRLLVNYPVVGMAEAAEGNGIIADNRLAGRRCGNKQGAEVLNSVVALQALIGNFAADKLIVELLQIFHFDYAGGNNQIPSGNGELSHNGIVR